MQPKSIIATLRLESLVLLAISLFAFYKLDGNWLMFILLLFAFDISMFGYLFNPRIGSVVYNLGHTATFPGLLALASWANNWRGGVLFALIWLAHIGLDRALGYGLKYNDKFQHTHLGTIGRKR